MDILKIIKDAQSGIYAWATLSQRSMLLVQAIQAAAAGPDFKPDNATKLHVTLMWSKSIPSALPDFQASGAEVLGAKVLGTEGDLVIVLTVKSDEIEAYARAAYAAGTEYTFSPFIPHITIGKVLEGDGEAICARLNAWLEETAPGGIGVHLDQVFYSFLEV